MIGRLIPKFFGNSIHHCHDHCWHIYIMLEEKISGKNIKKHLAIKKQKKPTRVIIN